LRAALLGVLVGTLSSSSSSLQPATRSAQSDSVAASAADRFIDPPFPSELYGARLHPAE